MGTLLFTQIINFYLEIAVQVKLSQKYLNDTDWSFKLHSIYFYERLYLVIWVIELHNFIFETCYSTRKDNFFPGESRDWHLLFKLIVKLPFADPPSKFPSYTPAPFVIWNFLNLIVLSQDVQDLIIGYPHWLGRRVISSSL